MVCVQAGVVVKKKELRTLLWGHGKQNRRNVAKNAPPNNATQRERHTVSR